MIRRPAVAGRFYPSDKHTLTKDVVRLLDGAKSNTGKLNTGKLDAKAIITPHAGYVYSGAIAASAFNIVKSSIKKYNRVLLLGPSHHIAFSGLALPEADVFETPLGKIKIDHAAVASSPHVHQLDDAHLHEHSLEVQLPFLQTLLENFDLIPLVVGDANPKQVANVISPFWQENNTLIVVSSDLSHFNSYTQAIAIDTNTTQLIESLNTCLSGHQACGCRAINGLLEGAKQRNYRAALIDYRNSGDTSGDKSRVVGYGAYVIH